MIIKILIIIGIVIGGTILLFPQNQDIFSNDIDKTMDELDYYKDNTVNNIGKTTDSAINTITTSFDDIINKIRNEINRVFVKPN